jgi:hypothetical protein
VQNGYFCIYLPELLLEQNHEHGVVRHSQYEVCLDFWTQSLLKPEKNMAHPKYRLNA